MRIRCGIEPGAVSGDAPVGRPIVRRPIIHPPMEVGVYLSKPALRALYHGAARGVNVLLAGVNHLAARGAGDGERGGTR